jgi:hypothetical protein
MATSAKVIKSLAEASPIVSEFRKSTVGVKFRKKHPLTVGVTPEIAKLVVAAKKEGKFSFRKLEQAFSLKPANGMTAYRVYAMGKKALAADARAKAKLAKTATPVETPAEPVEAVVEAPVAVEAEAVAVA